MSACKPVEALAGDDEREAEHEIVLKVDCCVLDCRSSVDLVSVWPRLLGSALAAQGWSFEPFRSRPPGIAFCPRHVDVAIRVPRRERVAIPRKERGIVACGDASVWELAG